MNRSTFLEKVLKIVHFQKITPKYGQLLRNSDKIPEKIHKLLRNPEVLRGEYQVNGQNLIFSLSADKKNYN